MTRRTIWLALTAALAAGCGGAGTGGTPGPGHGRPMPDAITGVFLRHDADHPLAGRPAAGVRIGLYARPISFAGPVMVDPPRPLRVVRTHRSGSFAFPGLGHRRYFVAAIDSRSYAIGRWARPGTWVVLRGCTDCPVPE